VGFEFEVNRNTYLANGSLSNAKRKTPALGDPPWHSGMTLGKGLTLIDGLNGVHAKTDLGGTWNDTNLEMEVDPVPETANGRAALERRLRKVEVLLGFIESQRNAGFYHISVRHLAAGIGGNAHHPHTNIYAAGAQTSGNPQATAGIRLDQVATMMETTLGGATGGPQQLLGAPGLDRIELGAASQGDFSVVGDAPRHVRDGIQAYEAKAYAHRPQGFPSAGLIGLCSVMLPYIVQAGAGPVAFAKVIAPLMARTDLGSMYMNGVPEAERTYFAAVTGDRWRLMWRDILTRAGVAGGIDQPLFVADPTAAQGARLPSALSRRQWLDGILDGEDRLTSEHIAPIRTTYQLTPSQVNLLERLGDDTGVVGANPTPEQADKLTEYRETQLFGLGGMGDKHENVGPGVDAPIFELRRMLQNIDTHHFTEMALGVFDYLAALNNSAPGDAAPVYQKANRNVSRPGRMEKMRFKMAA
jgi:hypothetical protein